jgi:aspartate dehydrogenase
MRVGVVGCGSIGGTLARKLASFAAVDRISFFDVEFSRAEALASLHRRYRAVRNLKALIAGSDLVVEAASQKAAREVAPLAVGAGKSVLLMSLGALADDRFTGRLLRSAGRTGGRIYIPSGALPGLEALASASAAEVSEVTLTTRKPPRALAGVAYLERRGIDLESLRAATVVFSGTAREAVRHFPSNVNVAAALSLAGIGFDQTRVVIIADPRATTNRHEVVAKGAFGELRCEVSNLPFPDNPKTSYLAALSAVATVRNVALGIHFGP